MAKTAKTTELLIVKIEAARDGQPRAATAKAAERLKAGVSQIAGNDAKVLLGGQKWKEQA
jgi:hypothetical protein